MQWITTGEQGQQCPEGPVSWIRERCEDRVNAYIKTVFASAPNWVPGCKKGAYALTEKGTKQLAVANGISVQQQQEIVKKFGAPAAKGQVGIKTLTAQGVKDMADANGTPVQQQLEIVKEIGVPAAKGQTLTEKGTKQLADANGISVQQQLEIVKEIGEPAAKGQVGIKTLTAQGVEDMADANGISVQQQQRIVKQVGAPAAKAQVGGKASSNKRSFAEAASIDQSAWEGQRVVVTAKGRFKQCRGTVDSVTHSGGLKIQMDEGDPSYFPVLLPKSVKLL